MEFQSWQDFTSFSHRVKHISRYIPDSEAKAFLETVVYTSGNKVKLLASGTLLWRAQRGCDYKPFFLDGSHMADFETPYAMGRMKPIADKALEGRANSKGIPVLYLSTDSSTACSETRPWIDSFITVARFYLVRDLLLADCTVYGQSGSRFYFEEPPAEIREECVWRDIDAAFSKPVDPCDEVADYAPTQILADLFKANGYDGVMYRSRLGKGHNIALFDLDSVHAKDSFLVQTNRVKFEFAKDKGQYSHRLYQSGTNDSNKGE